MIRKFLFLFIVVFVLCSGLTCMEDDKSGDSDDSDEADDTSDDTSTDDTSADDTSDDVPDDESPDDDPARPPTLSNGRWVPDTFTWDSSVDCSATVCSSLAWSVCDEQNNLSGGSVYIYNSGTTDWAFGVSFTWEELFPDGIPDVSNCDDPAEVSLGIVFPIPAEAGDYTLYVDIEGSDDWGDFSNKLTSIRVDYTYAP